MDKIPYTHLDLTLYHETLPNGLQIYIVPKETYNNVQATFVTKYGSNQNEFIPLHETKLKRVPDGVAHFLEHKLFEQEDGSDPFAFFDASGSECNASTNPWKTEYWFSGTSHFEKNMNFLLDFVQAPYFTKKSVEKEKGIIEQEIDMYQDNPYRVGFERSNFNSFVKHPIRIRTAGTKESVRSITKDDLYTCYHTFYHPSNMFIVITGNVNPEKAIDIIRQNQEKKKFDPKEAIQLSKIIEPDEVYQEMERISMNVTIPKIFLNYKMNISKIDERLKPLISLYISIFIDCKIGSTSLFAEELKKENIVHEDLYFGTIHTDTHLLLTIEGDGEKEGIMIKRIEEELQNKKVSEVDFNRKKKTILSSCLFMTDSIVRMNERVISDIIKDGCVHTNMFEDYKAMNYEDFKNIIDHLDWTHRSIVTIEPKTSN